MLSIILHTIGLLIFLKETRLKGESLELLKFMIDLNTILFVGAGVTVLIHLNRKTLWNIDNHLCRKN